jgi:ParB family transcriptional regulator, chromosome partitioning protein
MVPQVVSIPLSKIRPNPDNPRKVVRPEAVDACAASMKAVGQKTPIKVRQLKSDEVADSRRPKVNKGASSPLAQTGEFELVGGHIRLEAAKKLGWDTLNGIVLDITAEQSFLEAILDNRDEEMTWLEWYLAIEAFMAHNPGMKQNEVAEILEETPTSINRVVKLLKALNKAAREAILATCKNSSESYVIPEVCARRLGDLDEPAKVEKALRVVIDRKMTEPEVIRFVAWIKKGNYPSEYPMKGSTVSKKVPKFDPNDPNLEWWKSIPDWAMVKRDKQWGYILNGKLDKFGAPYGIYCLLSGMAKYFQRVEKVRNPEAVPDNPYEARLEELLEKGVREALDQTERDQKIWDAKQSRKASKEKTKAAKTGNKPVTEKPDVSVSEPKTGLPPEVSTQGGGPSEPSTEKEMKPLMDLLGNPDLKDNLKKMFGDLFK